MSNGYKFYLQRYAVGGSTFPVEDIEETYNCVFAKFAGYAMPGEIKNVYTEDYAEQNGARVYIPPKTNIRCKTFECTLTLLFPKETYAADVDRFISAYYGMKCEYHDTLRNKYATLLMTKQPKIGQEKLYSGRQYQLMEFTFTNLRGNTSKYSEI